MKGRKHGVQPFLVQIRNRDTLEPVAGVTVGDIGPKVRVCLTCAVWLLSVSQHAQFGFGEVDNGFMKLDGVRVKGSALLSRTGRISAEGGFKKPEHSRAAYLGMLAARSSIVQGASSALARALTITVRYSHVRRQFGPAGGPERQVVTYRSQYGRLFPLLATCFALWSTGVVCCGRTALRPQTGHDSRPTVQAAT